MASSRQPRYCHADSRTVRRLPHLHSSPRPRPPPSQSPDPLSHSPWTRQLCQSTVGSRLLCLEFEDIQRVLSESTACYLNVYLLYPLPTLLLHTLILFCRTWVLVNRLYPPHCALWAVSTCCPRSQHDIERLLPPSPATSTPIPLRFFLLNARTWVLMNVS